MNPGDEVPGSEPRPHLQALHTARGALRWVGVAGHGSPLNGRAHPETLDSLLIEAIPEYVAAPGRYGWTIMGVTFEPDDTMDRGVIVVERAPSVDRYHDPIARPRELRDVTIERVYTTRITVLVTS